MSPVTLNLLLAVIWMALQGELSLSNLILGFGVGMAAITIHEGVHRRAGYLRQVIGVVRLSIGFLRELVAANLQLARDILRPTPRFQPSIVRFDTSELGLPETVLLASLVSLTPGTLTIDVDEDGRGIYVHAVYGEPEAALRGIRLLADRILEASRGDSLPGRLA